MNIKQKLTSAAIIGAMMASVVAPTSFAATTVKVKKNGADSNNTVTVKNKKKTRVVQTNATAVVNLVGVFQNTGGNKVKNNTGDGDIDVSSGDATSTVTNRTTTGGNVANVDPCGCEDQDTTVVVRKNGAGSENNVTVKNKSTFTANQSNYTFVVNGVVVAQNTGGNSATGNTGDGGIDVGSGDAESTVTNTTTTGGNQLNP